ncbi:MAG: glycosyltransferase [Chryseolinea sp.]
MRPLVSVICLSYNHEKFIREAVESVLRQTYRPIEIILADDASTDESPSIIKEMKSEYPSLEIILSPVNVGNCKAFNQAYALTKGSYLIDFSTDDVMAEDRVEKQVAFFEREGSDTGVIFTDARYIDHQGNELRTHFKHLFDRNIISEIPTGDVYRDVLATYFIASPTMMFRREVLDKLGGYDEQLAYEDFDFTIRSSRYYKYGFLNEKLTSIRKLQTSMSAKQYARGDRQLYSTYLVCRKAKQLNRNAKDDRALMIRVRYELRQAVLSGKRDEALMFYNFSQELQGVRVTEQLLWMLSRSGFPFSNLKRLLQAWRYR